MPRYIPGKRSALFEKLGLCFGWIFHDGHAYLIFTEQNGHRVAEALLQDKEISAEEAQALKDEITKQGLAANINVIIEHAKAVPASDKSLQKVTFKLCSEPECGFKEHGLPHAWICYDDEEKGAFSVEEALMILFKLDRIEEDQNPLGPDDATRIIVEAANQGLLPEYIDVENHLKDLDPGTARVMRIIMLRIQDR